LGKIEIDAQKCLRDGLCVAICCESHVFAEGKNGEAPSVVNEKECAECGHCVSICPAGAIVHSGMDMSRFQTLDTGALPGANSVEALLYSMRTIRHYLNKPVPEATLEKLLQAGAMAASEHNAQDRQFIVIADRKIIADLSKQLVAHYRMLLFALRAPVIKIISIFNPGLGAYLKRSISDMKRKVAEYNADNDTIFHDAPCVIAITSSKGNILGKDSALTSQEAMRMLAYSMGMGVCISGYAIGAPSVVKRALKIPGNRQMHTLFTLGYPKYKFKKTPDRKQPVITRLS